MAELLIIADDFTGALDTGVQFAARGIETRVLVDDSKGGDIQELKEHVGAQVLVLDAETRHIESDKAYKKVFSITEKAKNTGISYIYKKTDSALRGNIGSELAAVLDASGEKVMPFIPAFPKMNRVTVEGIHYIDKIPVSESVFGQDPFEPVTQNSVKNIIRQQSNVEVTEIFKRNDIREKDIQEKREGIWVFDAESEEDLAHIAESLKCESKVHILAGCAGFAAKLPGIYEFQEHQQDKEILEEKLLVVCGSVNPITLKQLAYGENCGYCRIHLSAEEKLREGYWETKEGADSLYRLKEACENNICCIVDSIDAEGQNETMRYADMNHLSLEQVRKSISETLGEVLKQLLDKGEKAVLLVTGGDTLLGFMKKAGERELIPVCEVAPGCVLTKLKYCGEEYHIVTKSGGFGDERLLENIVKLLGK